jgi:hypothetical protein
LTAVTGRRAKASQDTTSYPGETRTILVVAVDHLQSAGDNQQQCRPQESPANRYITGSAGDAVGTLQGSPVDEHRCLVVYSDLLSAVAAASNAFVAEEQALEDVGPTEMAQAFKTACTRIEGRPTGPYRGPGVESPAYPPCEQWLVDTRRARTLY